MSASPKSKRAAPPRRFEDYVLTYEVGPGAGLFPVDSRKMQYVPKGPTTIYTNTPTYKYEAGAEGAPTGEGQIPIGFDLEIDGIVYKDLYVSVWGWALLLDPSRTTLSSFTEILKSLPSRPSINSSFTYDHILLAPWFSNMQNTFRYPDGQWGVADKASTYLLVTGWPGTSADLKAGRYPFPSAIDSTNGGVKYYRGTSGEGPYLVVRWKSFENSSNQYQVAHMDLVLYKSGRIEFRYSPRLRDFQNTFGSLRGTTVGIFSSGPSFYANRYRDFGYVLKKNESDTRGLYVNGGAVYDGVFTDTGGSSPPFTENYIVSLEFYQQVYQATLRSNWPGNDVYGGVFRFSPPHNKRKQTRSVVSLRDSKSFSGGYQDSYFDDQLTIPFNTQSIQYPIMMPTNTNVTTNSPDSTAVSELFTSSSIVVQRTVSPGLFDSVLLDAILEGRKRRGE